MEEVLEKGTTFQVVVSPSKQKSGTCVGYQIEDKTQASPMVSRATLLGLFYILVQGFENLHLKKVGPATQVLTPKTTYYTKCMKFMVACCVYADVCMASLAVGINQKSVFDYYFLIF
jgi:hypothetical protein